MKIENILAAKGPRVVTVDAGETVRTATRLLAEHNIGALVVVDGSPRPKGILSERDIVRMLATNQPVLDLPITDLMTADVVCGSPADDAESVLQTMTTARFRHMPIVQDGQLVGIVTIGDLVKAQLKEYQGDVDTLQTQLMTS